MRLDPADELTELLTLDQAADVAGVSVRTLNRWIAAGRLRTYRLPGTQRYVREDELLDVEHERRRSRRLGRPGARVTCTVVAAPA